jgi:hypothetical protein
MSLEENMKPHSSALQYLDEAVPLLLGCEHCGKAYPD